MERGYLPPIREAPKKFRCSTATKWSYVGGLVKSFERMAA